MEERKANFIINKSGGTASKGGYTYRITIPTCIAKDMGVSPDNKEALIYYNEETKELVIKKVK